MERDLDIMDRLIITNILPQENNIMTLKIIRDLKDQLGITENEHKECEIIRQGKGYSWNEKGKVTKVFEIGEIANDIIIKALRDLDKNKKLTEEMIGTYEKFVK